jgi:hypothetical protein
MRGIEDMVKVVIIVINLRRRQLALVYDVLSGERADVKSFGKSAWRQLA